MNELEGLFDNFLASKGLNRNSPVSGVDPSAFVAEWEIFILNYGRNQGRAGQGPVTQWGSPAPYGGSPVSYTHLDVYKRQVWQRACRKACRPSSGNR